MFLIDFDSDYCLTALISHLLYKYLAKTLYSQEIKSFPNEINLFSNWYIEKISSIG